MSHWGRKSLFAILLLMVPLCLPAEVFQPELQISNEHLPDWVPTYLQYAHTQNVLGSSQNRAKLTAVELSVGSSSTAMDVTRLWAFSPSAPAEVPLRGQNLVADIEHLPLRSRSVDLVIVPHLAWNLFSYMQTIKHHAGEEAQTGIGPILAEAHRILKRNGMIYLLYTASVPGLEEGLRVAHPEHLQAAEALGLESHWITPGQWPLPRLPQAYGLVLLKRKAHNKRACAAFL